MPRGVFEWTFQNNGSALSHYTWARPQVPLDLFLPFRSDGAFGLGRGCGGAQNCEREHKITFARALTMPVPCYELTSLLWGRGVDLDLDPICILKFGSLSLKL